MVKTLRSSDACLTVAPGSVGSEAKAHRRGLGDPTAGKSSAVVGPSWSRDMGLWLPARATCLHSSPGALPGRRGAPLDERVWAQRDRPKRLRRGPSTERLANRILPYSPDLRARNRRPSDTPTPSLSQYPPVKHGLQGSGRTVSIAASGLPGLRRNTRESLDHLRALPSSPTATCVGAGRWPRRGSLGNFTIDMTCLPSTLAPVSMELERVDRRCLGASAHSARFCMTTTPLNTPQDTLGVPTPSA